MPFWNVPVGPETKRVKQLQPPYLEAIFKQNAQNM